MPKEGHAEVVIAPERRPDKMYPPKVSADALKTYQDKRPERTAIFEIYAVEKHLSPFDNERGRILMISTAISDMHR